MKFLLLDCLVIIFVVVITELFWLGKAGLTWVIAGYALVAALQVTPLLVHREESENG